MTKLIEIQNQIARLQKQADEMKSAELATAMAEVLQKMDDFGISIDDLRAAKGHKRKTPKDKSINSAPIKFRGPKGETWSGRGMTPRWLSTAVANGMSKASFAV